MKKHIFMIILLVFSVGFVSTVAFVFARKFADRKEAMKKLKIVFAAAGLLLVAICSLEAAPVDYYLWTNSGGTWSDADKTVPDNADDVMCWAASASNILEWTGLGKVVGLTNTDQIFQYFQNHWTDRGGLMEYGWDWWFSGTYHGPVVGGVELTGSANPIWSQPDVPGGDFYPSQNFNNYFHEAWGSSVSLSTVDQYLHSGYGTTLAVYSPTLGHSLTVWGFEYDVDDPAYYTGVYVTDSDDRVNALRYYEVENVGGNWYVQGLYGTNDTWQIRGVQAMSPLIIPKPTNVVTVSATNNWDGTVTVGWTLSGSYELIRQQWNGEDWIDHKPFGAVTGKIKTDKYDLDDLKKNYRYALKPLCSSSIIYTSNIVKPEIIVVLVRGYSISFNKAKNDNYWKADNCTGVVDVNYWFDSNKITCWEPPQGYLSGEGLCGWKSVEDNAMELKTFINSKMTGSYANAKINLIGHSMGGLIARKYAHDNQEIVAINNIFCIATPHTGTPLAELKGYLDITKALFVSAATGHSIEIPNKATKDLTPYTLKTFNSKYPVSDNTKLYAFTSNNCQRLQNNLYYIVTNFVILFDMEFSNNGEHSDGAVPYRSALGEYYKQKPPSSYHSMITSATVAGAWEAVATPVVYPITDTCDTHLDHDTSYRHTDTLGQILKWLGFSQSSSFKSMSIKLQNETEQENLPLYYIDGFTGEFDSGQPVSKAVKISGGQKAYFRAITSDVNCMFTLTDPCGIIYNSAFAAIDPNVSYEAKDGILIYEVNSPVAGIWLLNLSTNLPLPISLSYGLTAFEDANIRLSSYILPDWINTDANIMLVSELTGNDVPIPDADITAEITLPDSNTVILQLYDDGLHNDANSGDGIYANVFSDTAQVGSYNAYIHATGVISGCSNFERAATTSFTASKAGISIDGDITDNGIDQNHNGHYDALRITVPIDVNVSGSYRLTASLLDDSNDTITLINSGEIKLEPLPEIDAGDLDGNKKVNFIDFSMFANMWQAGTVDINDLGAMAENWLEGTIHAAITIDVPAKEIAKHGTDGPFKLVNIEITDANSGMIITTAGDYITSAYSLTDFELLDTDKDGLPDSLEQEIGTDPNKVDTDEDGATDCQEISVDGNSVSYNPLTDSNPLDIDTDEDGMTDGYEISYGLNPLADDTLDDFDGDGLTNIQEYNLHTRPDKIDTDGDGASDYQEVSCDGNSASYNPLTDSNPLDIDTDKDGMTDGYEISYGLNPLVDDTLDDLDDDGLTNIQEYNLHTRPDKIDTDDDGRNDKWEIDNSTNPLAYEIYTRIAGDINLNASVDFPDLVIIANQWLQAPGIPSADIAPDGGDGIVNMLDFAVFAGNWLVEQ